MEILFHFIDFSYLFAIVPAFIFKNKIGRQNFVAIITILAVSVVPEIFHTIIYEYKLYGGLIVHHGYTLATLFVIFPILYKKLENPRINQFALYFTYGLGALYFIAILYNKGYESPLAIFTFIIKLAICLVCLTYFYKVMMEMKIPSPKNQPFFWIFSAQLIFNGSTIILNLFLTFIIHSKELYAAIWPIQQFSLIVYLVFLAFASLIPGLNKGNVPVIKHSEIYRGG